MRTRGFILADILGAQEGAAPAPAPISPPGPPDEATLRERVRQAYLDVTGGLFKTRALLSDVRSKLNDIDRATLDALLKRMQRDEQALLYQLDNRPEITDADREAAIYFGTEPAPHSLDRPMNELDVFRSVNFDWTRQLRSIWRDPSYHVPAIHQSLLDELVDYFARNTSNPDPAERRRVVLSSGLRDMARPISLANCAAGSGSRMGGSFCLISLG